MKRLRFLLFPFGILYRIITSVRNLFYDNGIFKSFTAPIPTIVVGNLSVGGTGKSPQIEYLIRLLAEKYRVATLSRGYKRKSKGFVLANQTTKVEDLGDEPYQFFSKFKNIYVAVDADRTNGIQQLLKLNNPPEVILLDDAYQHRKVKASFYILLTTYKDLYCDDFVLPVGNLRESKTGAKRAKAIIVTKCPPMLSDSEKEKIKTKLKLESLQKLFFTTIGYDDFVFSKKQKLSVYEIKSQPKIILAGIAKPEPFFNHLKNENDLLLKYPDHHNFSDKEIEEIKSQANGKIIVTTEKDYVRIKDKFDANQLYYLPIKTEFLNDVELFNRLIVDLIGRKPV
jgi:tetraacyldisaccharide 4'-kinase